MNEYIAQVVDELYELGVRDIVLSPGSRSTPLAILFSKHKFKTYMNIDERSAAFFALGMAKAKQIPAVLVCTSGSACAHYMPAIIEAQASRIPLIILSADRPAQLQNVSAPQTINQNNIFGSFVKYCEELAIEASNVPLGAEQKYSYARLVMQRAFMQACAVPKGVAHINIPLNEPLVPDMATVDFSNARAFKPFQFFTSEFDNPAFIKYFLENFITKKGIIICGPCDGIRSALYYEKIITASALLNAPLLADPLSQFRAYEHENIITTYDAFLKSEHNKENLLADYILLIGQPPVSKRLYQFIQLHNKAEILQLDECVKYRNPALNTSKIIQISPLKFAQELCYNEEQILKICNTTYVQKWKQNEQEMSAILADARQCDVLFEGKIIQLIQDKISHLNAKNAKDKVQLMFANSMSIRDADFFWEARKQDVEFFGNRGANGIDGTVSTALGIATTQKTTILVSGDLAFFHDLTGLLLGKKCKLCLTIVLFNNNGGGIFQYLPQAGVDDFEYLFLTPHDVDFGALSALYSINYVKIGTYEQFDFELSQATDKQGINILEIPINMQESKELHQRFTNSK